MKIQYSLKDQDYENIFSDEERSELNSFFIRQYDLKEDVYRWMIEKLRRICYNLDFNKDIELTYENRVLTINNADEKSKEKIKAIIELVEDNFGCIKLKF